MAITVPVQNRVDVAGLTKKWEKWLKGVQSDEKRTTLAIMLENQHNYNKRGLLKEATVAGDAGAFQKVILPVIRRVFPRLVAPELVGVQPMTGPTGLAIFLKYFYEGSSTTKGILQPEGDIDGRRIYMRSYESGPFLKATVAATGGAGAITGDGGDSIVADYRAAAVLPAGQTTTFVSWSGPMKFQIKLRHDLLGGGLDIVDVTIQIEQTAAYGASAPTWTASILEQAAVVTPVAGNVTRVVETPVAFGSIAKSTTSGYIAIGVPATWLKSALEFAVYGNNTDDLDLQSGPVPGGADAAASICTDAVWLDSSGCPILYSQGMESAAPASLSVKFETHPIVAEDYKLQATWSLEAAQDINALHGESLEEVLSNLLTQELMNEIDFVVIRDLLSIAGIAATWNKFPGTTPVTQNVLFEDGKTVNEYTGTMPAYRGTLRDWWETLVFLMNDVANSIHTRILRGPANFAVCSPDVSTILESLPEFKSSSLNDLDTEVGIVPVGTLTSKYKLYKDARLSKGTLLMGYKGQDSRNTGYIYAPYVPATLSPIIWDPDTYNNKRMIMTRFGRTTLLDGQFFYARIRVTESSNITTDWTSV